MNAGLDDVGYILRKVSLDHMIVLVLVSWVSFILISIVTA